MPRILLCSFVLAALSCGGSSSNYPDLANKCASPRTGLDPFTSKPFPDKQGTATDEKRFLRAWSDDLYLWYRELPGDSPEDFKGTVLEYFDDLRTRATTPSGKNKDQFHFTYKTSDWQQLSQSGVEAGYGVTWALVSRSPPRKAFAAYTEPGSTAETVGITRGTEVVAVDGVAVIDGDRDALNNGMFPQAAGETHTFSILDRGAAPGTAPHDVTMTSAAITTAPVQHVGLIPNSTTGYMLFNAHIGTAEKALADGIQKLKDLGATDLVLDMRYNGGGYVVVASQLAYMIAKTSLTTGKTFEKTTYNDKHATVDPFSGDAIQPFPFVNVGVGLSVPQNQPLPNLGLDHVSVLTGAGTCSASESVINGLLGVDVQVNLFGKTTCGKPYGFVPADNCGTTYFSIQFEGQNQKGFGDYADGFIPGGGGPAGPPGCDVADDFSHELGDPAEARLAAALYYRANGTCPPTGARNALQLETSGAEPYLVRSPFLENRIYWRGR